MAGLILFIAGGVIGALAVAFIQGATTNEKEHEIYMEGYRAGQIECMRGEEE